MSPDTVNIGQFLELYQPFDHAPHAILNVTRSHCQFSCLTRSETTFRVHHTDSTSFSRHLSYNPIRSMYVVFFLPVHNTHVTCTERYREWVPGLYAEGAHLSSAIYGRSQGVCNSKDELEMVVQLVDKVSEVMGITCSSSHGEQSLARGKRPHTE